MHEAELVDLPWPEWNAVRRIGSGSYGAVYEAVHQRTGERSAVKVISVPRDPGDVDSDYAAGYSEQDVRSKYTEQLGMIEREYDLMAEMRGHPNIVSCDDIAYVNHSNGVGWDIFIRMELLTPLTKLLRADAFGPKKVAELGCDICSALVLCEQKYVVHRDVKPQNVLVSADGRYKLGDFGVARVMDHTTAATHAGTHGYMAPEVYGGGKYGKQADIYSLGIVLYWLLNGRRFPFEPVDRVPSLSERNEALSLRMRGEGLPWPMCGSYELRTIVLKACAFRPSDRYDSAVDLLMALHDVPELNGGGEGSVSYAGQSAECAYEASSGGSSSWSSQTSSAGQTGSAGQAPQTGSTGRTGSASHTGASSQVGSLSENGTKPRQPLRSFLVSILPSKPSVLVRVKEGEVSKLSTPGLMLRCSLWLLLLGSGIAFCMLVVSGGLLAVLVAAAGMPSVVGLPIILASYALLAKVAKRGTKGQEAGDIRGFFVAAGVWCLVIAALLMIAFLNPVIPAVYVGCAVLSLVLMYFF